MNMSEPEKFAVAQLRGELLSDVPMRRHTSWRAGGQADRAYRPADLADLQAFLATLPSDEPIYPVGLGSNLLVRDGGLRGTVLLMHGALTGLRMTAPAEIYAEAGVAGAKLARFAAQNDLCGAEFFAGIPGTLGGMLAMNAGCYGGETWNRVLRVQTINRRGELCWRNPAEYEVGYRHAHLLQPAEAWFVAAALHFEPGDASAARQAIKTLLDKRMASQPLQMPNAGSVFRNPPGDFAARLIEQCALKGKRIGGAQVSEKHANFIVNVGDASAADIEMMIHEVQQIVAEKTGVQLQPEVRIIGETK
ncbi:MAG: UDP-N-acetylmuramate dehydrogenase [Gallionella sp.]|jgi:UDP-N-acetylmuramate dehydrogenase|nr:UDP-N-acetylmuramate dehydrogenase [Gallionella sp.]